MIPVRNDVNVRINLGGIGEGGCVDADGVVEGLYGRQGCMREW